MELHVLILEDRPEDAELMVHELRNAGFDSVWQRVDNKADFVAHLDPPPDIVLADYALPQWDGVRALATLQAHSLDIPFIMISGTVGEDIAVECMKQGAADYFLKDRMARLGQAVLKALEDKRLRVEKLQAEAALRESEERHRLLFEHAGLGIGYFTPEGQVVAFNQAAAANTGGVPADFIGRNVIDIYGEDVGTRALRRIRIALESDNHRVYEDLVPLATGEKWFILTFSRIVDASGVVAGVQIISEDITERKQAEDRVRRLNAVLRAIRNVNQLIVHEKDRDRLLQDATDLLIATRGYRMAWITLIDESGAQSTMVSAGLEANGSLLEQRLQRNEWVYCAQYTLAHPDILVIEDASTVCGDCPLANVSQDWGSMSIQLSHEGQVFGMLTVSAPLEYVNDAEEHDLLEEIAGDIAFALHGIDLEQKRKESEDALRKLSQAVEYSPSMVYITDSDSRLEYVNPKFTEITGYTLEEALGRLPRILDPDKISREEYEERWRVIRSGREWRGEFQNRKKNGEPFWESASISSIKDETGVISNLVLVIEDITERKRVEQALASNYQLLRTLIDSLPDRIYAKDTEGRFTLKNRADALQMGAASPEETLGKTDYDYYPPPIATRYDADDQAIIQSGQPLINREEPYVAQDGSTGWMLTTKTPLRDPQGNVVGLVGIGRDITGRKLREEQLRSERDFSDSLIRTAQAIVLVLNLEGRIVSVNPYMEELSGYRLEEIQGMDWFTTFLPEREQNETRELFQKAITGIQTRGAVNTIVTREGKERQIEWYDNTLNDADGAPGGLLAIGLDVTERIQARQQLQELNVTLEQRVIERTEELNHAMERIEAILNSSNDVLILCRTEGTIDQVNPAFEAMFHCDTSSVLNRPIDVIVVPEHVVAMQRAFTAVVETLHPERIEIKVRYAHGDPFDADVVLSPIVGGNGQLLGVVSSLRDITQHKQMQVKLRKMLEHEIELSELKSRYVSMAAHDLRNPLAVIQSSVNLINQYGDRLTPERIQTKFNTIETNIQIMVEMLDNILTLGKVESGKLSFDPGKLDIVAFCATIIEETQQTVGALQLIDFSSDGGCQDVVLDAKLLRHILGNLLSNALKYSLENSSVKFTVQCEPSQISFCIQDHGIGIPEDDQQRLFETFHRAQNARQIPGTGLGLAIVKQSVELHGGTITFESQEGVGTTFTVVIPQIPSNI